MANEVNIGGAERLVSGVAGTVLTMRGLRRGSLAGALVGGALAARGITGHSFLYRWCGVSTAEGGASQDIEIHRVVTVMKEPREVYDFWRQLENLPGFMKHLDSVIELDSRRSHWVATARDGLVHLEWEAEIVDERPGERLAWRSLPGSTVHNEGEVRFREAPGGRGTEVSVRILYRPPAGGPGKIAAKALNPLFARLVREDVRAFKGVAEAGELATIERQPVGMRPSSRAISPPATSEVGGLS